MRALKGIVPVFGGEDDLIDDLGVGKHSLLVC